MVWLSDLFTFDVLKITTSVFRIIKTSLINDKFLSSADILKNCSIAIINNEKMINSTISTYSLSFEFVIDKSFNKINCDNAISNKLKEMKNLFFKSLLQDQVRIYENNLYLINKYEKDKSKVINKILDQFR